MLLICIVHTAILKGSLYKYCANGKFEKLGNAHVVLSFVCPNSEIKNYSEKPIKQKPVQRLLKTKVVSQLMKRVINMLLKLIRLDRKQTKLSRLQPYQLYVHHYC